MTKAAPLPINDKRASQGRMQVIASAILFSLTGVFVKLISADGWTIVVLRGVFIVLFFGVLLWARGTLAKELRDFSASAWAATLCAAISGTTFILAFKYTSIANVALIYATAPFMAAFIAWIWFGERPRPVVMLAGLTSLGGVGLIMQNSLGGGNLFGDLLALVMTFSMACYLCVYRRCPDTPNTLPIVLANAMPVIATGVLWLNVTVPIADMPMIAIFSLSFCAAAFLLAEGSKWISTSESALLSALETPLAPIFAFLLLSTVPSQSTLLGGAIILASSVLALSVRK